MAAPAHSKLPPEILRFTVDKAYWAKCQHAPERKMGSVGNRRPRLLGGSEDVVSGSMWVVGGEASVGSDGRLPL